jgi:hypothetical protein
MARPGTIARVLVHAPEFSHPARTESRSLSYQISERRSTHGRQDDPINVLSLSGFTRPCVVSVAFDNFEEIRAEVTNPDSHFLRNGSGPSEEPRRSNFA